MNDEKIPDKKPSTSSPPDKRGKDKPIYTNPAIPNDPPEKK
ncbi:MAG: hypothetical protein ACQEP5_05070 [Actinomycetota bacterium]